MVVALEAEVVRDAQQGDRAAFGTLYDAYLPKIYDFALGMLRNRADAEDVTSETFLRAVERLGSLTDPEAFRGWLYTIARNNALSVIEARKRAVPTADHDESATAMATESLPEPETRAESDEMRELVWDAAAALNPRDHQVFELTVRHGLSSGEIAPILGVRPAYAYILVNRLKGSVEEALEAVLLTRHGRPDCPELDRLVGDYGAEPTPRMRKAVMRHAKGCEACGQTKRTKASVPLMLAGMAFASPSAAFAAELASKIDAAWRASPTPGGGSGGGSGGGKLAHLLGAAVTVVVLTGVTIGVAAQRTIERFEEVEAEPVAEEVEPSPSPTPDPSPAPAPRAPGPGQTSAPQPQGTPTVVIVDGGTQGDVDEGEEGPRRTLPPLEPTPPPETQEPQQPPVTGVG